MFAVGKQDSCRNLIFTIDQLVKANHDITQSELKDLITISIRRGFLEITKKQNIKGKNDDRNKR